MSFEIGQIVKSMAGHDKQEYYVIIDVKDSLLYLVNGTNRTIDKPKKKKIIHVQPTKKVDKTIAEKINSGTILNEEIKRTIKLYMQMQTVSNE